MFINWIALSYYAMFVPILIWGGMLYWQWLNLPAFAGEVYDSNTEKGLLDPAIGREDYIETYVRTEGPRSGTYRCVAAFFALLVLPVLISLFNTGWDTVWRWLGAVEGPYERGYMLHTFLTFVFVMAVLVGGLYLLTSYYYKRRPPSLTSELKRLKEQAS